MFNENYAKQLAQKIGNSIQRVINDEVEVYVATKPVPYIETSNDRPNFYTKHIFEKEQGLDPTLTVDKYIDNQIKKYETEVLGISLISGSAIINSYLIDNFGMTISLRPGIVKQQVPALSNIYALSYIKVVIKDTQEAKYFWIDHIQTNESRKESITLTCSLDKWMTYFKEVIPNIQGDVKILRRHANRYLVKERSVTNPDGTTNNEKYLVGDYSQTSTVHNIDGEFANLTTNTVRSLGVEIPKDNDQVDLPITLTDNKIYLNFKIKKNNGDLINANDYLVESYWDETYITHFFFVNNMVQGSGKPLVCSKFDNDGRLQGTTRTYKSDGSMVEASGFKFTGTKDFTIKQKVDFDYDWERYKNPYDTETYHCYGPKSITISNSGQTNEYIYTYRFDSQDGKKDAYGVLVSNTDKSELKSKSIINRIDNVYNTNIQFGRGFLITVHTWRWELRTPNNAPYELDTFNITESQRQQQIVNEGWTLVGLNTTTFTNVNKLELYLVGYDNSGNELTKFKMKPASISSYLPITHASYWKNFPFPYTFRGYYKWFDTGLKNTILFTFLQDDYNKYLAQKPFICISFNGTTSFRQEGRWTSNDRNRTATTYEIRLIETINDNGQVNIEQKSEPYTITEWNKGSNVECEINKQMILPEYNGLMNDYKTTFVEPEYTKDKEWEYMYEPQLKMGHCIKHFLDYLGMRKQLFTEFGNINTLTFSQTILPQGAVDKIYYTDIQNDYNMWELSNTNGFLTKAYDNSIPTTLDRFTQFVLDNQAQLQNGLYAANQNIEYTKQQNSINAQQNSLNSQKAWVNGAFGLAGGMISTGVGIGSMVASGGMMGGGAVASGLKSVGKSIGDLIFTGKQNELNTKQTELNNQRDAFNAQQNLNGLYAVIKDKFNQPDQLNQGSVEVNGILRYKAELNGLFNQYGTGNGKVDFKIDTQAPTINQLKEYSMFLNMYGYISNETLLNAKISDMLTRTRFNYLQVSNVQNMFSKIMIENRTKNYFMSLFSEGVRMWNLDYEGQEMNDYSKENWEVSVEKELNTQN